MLWQLLDKRHLLEERQIPYRDQTPLLAKQTSGLNSEEEKVGCQSQQWSPSPASEVNPTAAKGENGKRQSGNGIDESVLKGRFCCSMSEQSYELLLPTYLRMLSFLLVACVWRVALLLVLRYLFREVSAAFVLASEDDGLAILEDLRTHYALPPLLFHDDDHSRVAVRCFQLADSFSAALLLYVAGVVWGVWSWTHSSPSMSDVALTLVAKPRRGLSPEGLSDDCSAETRGYTKLEALELPACTTRRQETEEEDSPTAALLLLPSSSRPPFPLLTPHPFSPRRQQLHQHSDTADTHVFGFSSTLTSNSPNSDSSSSSNSSSSSSPSAASEEPSPQPIFCQNAAASAAAPGFSEDWTDVSQFSQDKDFTCVDLTDALPS